MTNKAKDITFELEIPDNYEVVPCDIVEVAFANMVRELDLIKLERAAHAALVLDMCKRVSGHGLINGQHPRQPHLDGYRMRGNGSFMRKGGFRLFEIVELTMEKIHD